MKVAIKSEKGITLVALVITIIVLIILATISINLIFGEEGILERAEQSNEQYKKGEAREKLALVLADAQIEKGINKKYNQNEFLDEFILKQLPEAQVLENIVIVDGYAFSIDRSVPKIGEYIGKEDTLQFPDITANIAYANDYKTAIITITAQEAENGISKIEVIQAGFVLETYTYENTKEQITETYTAKQNGEYIIKVYSDLTSKGKTEVTELIPGVIYEPNGNTEYKKEHTLTVSAAEDVEKVKSIKYQWLATTVEPEASTFTKEIENGGTITENTLTGQYYLWTLLETESGKQIIERSEVFYLDNQGPTVSSLTSTPVSATSFTLKATASDAHIGKIAKYEFYVGGVLKNTQETTATSASYTATGVNTGNTSCYVIVTDSLNNTTKKTVTATTQLYTWEKYSCNSTTKYVATVEATAKYSNTSRSGCGIYGGYFACFNTCTGCWTEGASFHNCTNARIFSGRCLYAGYNYAVKYCLVCSFKCNSNNICYYVYNQHYVYGVKNVTYSKGTTQYDDVSSANGSAYPNGGHQNGYWYVYKGVY